MREISCRGIGGVEVQGRWNCCTHVGLLTDVGCQLLLNKGGGGGYGVGPDGGRGGLLNDRRIDVWHESGYGCHIMRGAAGESGGGGGERAETMGLIWRSDLVGLQVGLGNEGMAEVRFLGS